METWMKRVNAMLRFLMVADRCSAAPAADNLFAPDKIDPAGAGMSAERLARSPRA